MSKDMGVPASPSGHSSKTEPSCTVSAQSVSVPNAGGLWGRKNGGARALICKPLEVFCKRVTARQIADAIDRLANCPNAFLASDLAAEILPGEKWLDKQEALNRLFQRWRKLGLVEFRRGKWSLTRGAWDVMQASAIEARRAETLQDGSVHESATAEGGDAQETTK